MLIAGEPSGDLLAAELVSALREACASSPQSEFRNLQFIGANSMFSSLNQAVSSARTSSHAGQYAG